MIAQEILWHLGRVSLQASVLALLVLLVQWLARERLSARWRSALWVLVLVRLTVPSLPETRWSVFNWMRLSSPSLQQNRPEAYGPTPVEQPRPQQQPTRLAAPSTEASQQVRNDDRATQTSVLAEPSATAPISPANHTTSPRVTTRSETSSQTSGTSKVLLILWLAGFGLLLGKAIWNTVRLNRRLNRVTPHEDPKVTHVLSECRKQMGMTAPLEWLETDIVQSPALHGWFRTRLLLPVGYVQETSSQELRLVFLHELAHVKRWDIAVNWLVTVLQFLHWFNPVLWFAFSRYRADRELACDELALEYAGDSEVEAYGETILRLLGASMRPSKIPNLVGISEDYRQLKERITRIALFRSGSRWSALGIALAATLSAVALTDARSAETGDEKKLPPTQMIRLTNHFSPEDQRDKGKPIWSGVPRGTNEFGGVEFLIDGPLQLQGRGPKSAGRTLPESVRIDLPTNNWGSVHLITGTSYDATPGTRIAELVWSYTDRSSRRVPIEYAVHTRDWWRAAYEEPAHVSNTNSRVVWRGEHPEAATWGKTLRLYKTTLANPLPTKRVRAVEFVSAMNNPGLVVLGATLDPLPPGSRPDPSGDLEHIDPPATNHLALSVVDESNEQALDGVVIQSRISRRVGSREVAHTRQITNDSTGSVVLDLPSKDLAALDLTASKDGFVSASIQWRVSDASPLPSQHRFRLGAGMKLGGIVLDPEGNPLAGAPINAGRFWTGNDERFPLGERAEFKSRSTVTDAEGRWQITGVPSNLVSRISVSVNHPDFLRSVVSPIGKDPAQLAALKESRHEFRLRRGLVIAGGVEDLEGNGIASAKVWFGRPNFGNRRETTTDATGEFEFRNVDTNVGDVDHAREPISVSATGFESATTHLVMAEVPAKVVLQLKKGSVLQGRVVNTKGEGLVDAQVILQGHQNGREEAPWEFRSVTDAEGRFRWDGAPPREMLFTFFMQGYQAQRDVAIKPSTEQGEPVEHVVTLQPEIIVSGQVVDAATGKPIHRFSLLPGEGAGESFHSYSPSEKRDYAHDEGRFEFVLAESEHNLLQIEAEDFESKMVPIPEAKGGSVVLPPTRLESAPGVRGVVMDPLGQPVPGVSMLFALAAGPLRVGYTRAGFESSSFQNGMITQTDREGRYRFQSKSKGQWRVIAMNERGYVQALILQSGELPPLVLQPYGSLEGTLIIGGQVSAGRKLVLQLEGGMWGMDDSLTATTDTNGRFRMDRVPPGSHTLFRSVPTGFFSRMNSHGTEVRISPGRSTDVVLQSEGALVTGIAKFPDALRTRSQLILSGSLQTMAPRPPQGIQSAQEMEAWNASPEVQNYRRARKHYTFDIAPDGRFLVDGVAPGHYSVFLSAMVRSTTIELTDDSLASGRTEVEVPEAFIPNVPLDAGSVEMVPSAP
jgi:beta-lactamase regulating signal transducer with metallopeptidase domain/protocatechuate 3,4-dioxygenase beta subunit